MPPTSKSNEPPAARTSPARASTSAAKTRRSFVPASEIGERIDPSTAALFDRARAAEAASPERGIEAWREAAQKARHHRTPLRALARLHESLGQWAPLAEALRKEAALAVSKEDKRALLEPLVAIYRDKLHLGVRAVAVLQQIVQLAPRDLAALDQLADLYEQLKRWSDLVAVLRKRAPLSATNDDRVATWLRVAELYAERVGNKTQAIEAYQRILELDAANAQALEQLKALYEARRDWTGMIELSRREIALLDDADARAARYAEAARVAATKLDKPELAMDLWSDVLAEDPWNQEALGELERLSDKNKDWQRLAGVLQRQAEAATDSAQQVELLEKLAFLSETQLGDSAAAIATWRSLLELRPEHGPALRALERLLLAAEAFEELESIYTAQSRWKDLARVLERRAAAADPDRRPALLLRVAAIYRDELSQEDEAARLCERILAIDADNLDAAEALIPWYEASGNDAALARALAVRAQHTSDDESKRELLARITDLCEEDADTNPSDALRARLAQLALDPADAETRARAETLAEASSAWALFARALEATWEHAADPSRLSSNMLAAVRAHERAGDLEAALRVNAQILELDPEHVRAIEDAERLCARTERWDQLEALYRTRIERAAGPDARKELLHRLAALHRDQRADPERARLALHEALALDAEDVPTVLALAELAAGDATEDDRWGSLGARPIAVARGSEKVPLEVLERIYRDGSHFQALAELLARADSVLAEEPDDHVALLVELSRVQGEALEDPRQALASLERAATIAPDDARPLDALAELCRRSADWRGLARISRRRAELAEDPDERADALLDAAAAIAQEADDVAPAEELYREVLRLEPRHPDALAALERLYLEARRWTDLLEVLAEQCAAATDAEQRIAIQLQAARISAEELRDARGAIAIYEAILELEPTNAAAMEALAGLYQSSGRMAEYLELLESRLTSAESDAERVVYCRQIAAVYAVQLGRNDFAAQYLERAFAIDHEGQHYRDLLRAYRSDRRFDAVASVIERHIEATDSAGRIAGFLELGQLRSGQLADVEGAIQAYRAALDLDADNLRALDALARLLEEREFFAEAASVLERLCAASSRGAERAAARYRLGCLLQRGLGDSAAAEEQLRQALEEDPSHADATFGLADFAEAREDWAAAADLLLDTASQASDPRVQARLLARAGELCERELGDPESAAQLYARALDCDPGMAQAGNALVRFCEKQERHEELMQVLTLLLGHAGRYDRRWRHALHLKLASTAETLGHFDQALEHYQAAWELDPADVPTLVGMTNLQQKLRE